MQESASVVLTPASLMIVIMASSRTDLTETDPIRIHIPSHSLFISQP